LVLCYLSMIKWFRYIIPLLLELVCWFNGERRLRKKVKSIRSRRGVSPVIATVIMVAVTITVAVAVAYWMSGIAGQYTKFEKVEIQSGYATLDPLTGWTITLELKNSGSATANLIKCFVNDIPVDKPGATGFAGATIVGASETGSTIPDAGIPINSGMDQTVSVYIGKDLFSSGTTINIKLHSAGGMDYIKLVELV